MVKTFIVAMAISMMMPKTIDMPMYQPHYVGEDIIHIEVTEDLEQEPWENIWTIPTQANCDALAEKINDRRVEKLARTVYGEGNGCSEFEREQIVWCILNRVSDPRFPNSVGDVVSQDGQFNGYSPNYPVTEDNRLIAEDVYERWQDENDGKIVERELGSDYCWFSGDGEHNHFRTTA